MTISRLLALLAALASASAVQAAPGGRLDTMLQGRWTCEVPGDALARPVPRPDDSFRIVPDSSYLVEGRGRGAYLLLGDQLAMTSGPFAGRRFRLEGTATAHPLDGGKVRCVRAGTPTGDIGAPRPKVP